MATWKKIIVSGSNAELSNLEVDSLIQVSNNQIISSSAADTKLSGSFSGSFTGDGSGLTGVVAASGFSLTQGSGIVPFSYNGESAQTVSVSGSAQLSDDIITKWDATDGKFVNSSLTDNGTIITGVSSIQLTGANSILTGSFQGNLAGTADTASYVEFDDVANKPTLVSGSSQIDLTQTTNYESGIKDRLNAEGVFSSSAQLNNSTLTGMTITGSFTGSFSGDGSGLTGIVTSLDVSGSDGTGVSIDLKTQDLTIGGTAGEIETSVIGTTVTIGLPDEVTIQDLNVTGDLTVLGTASFQETTNLTVADRFILLASGSNTAGDGGFIVQQSTQGVGELFGFDSSTLRWSVTSSYSANQSSFNPDAFMAAVIEGIGTDPSVVDTRYNKKGNIFVGTDENIWIYS